MPATRKLLCTAGVCSVLLATASCSGEDTASGRGSPLPAPKTASVTSSPPQGSPSPATRTLSSWTPIPLSADESLPGGRMGMTANGRPDAPWAVVEVPKGFSTINGWVIFDEDPKGGGGVGYWTVSEVVRNPCGDPEPIQVGNTVDELVAAFKQQRLTRMSAPAPVTVDGYHGLSLELAVPQGIDFAACPQYNLWESDPAGARHFGGPGEFDRLWILDVAGDVVVLTVTADAGVPKTALDRLTRMVNSVEFAPRSS